MRYSPHSLLDAAAVRAESCSAAAAAAAAADSIGVLPGSPLLPSPSVQPHSPRGGGCGGVRGARGERAGGPPAPARRGPGTSTGGAPCSDGLRGRAARVADVSGREGGGPRVRPGFDDGPARRLVRAWPSWHWHGPSAQGVHLVARCGAMLSCTTRIRTG